MTTIPSRIASIRPAVEAVLAQTVRVHHLEMNIPERCTRTGEAYVIPDWLASMDRVAIFRTDDLGPITKIGPTLLRYRDDETAYIFSVDDDCAYPDNQLELLCHVHDPASRRILTRYGGYLSDDGVYQPLYGCLEVTMMEGFGGILYPPGCIDDEFESYLDLTSASAVCRRNDDIVLAMYFRRIGVPMLLYNQPSDEVPYLVTGWLPHSKTDALSAQGHVQNFKDIHAFVSSTRWFRPDASAKPFNDATRHE